MSERTNGAGPDGTTGRQGQLPALPPPRAVAGAVARGAREATYVGVGLTVLGVQQFQANRDDLQTTLSHLGLHPLARATGCVGRFLEARTRRLVGGPTPTAR